MNDLTIVSCNYNTNDLILNLVKSIKNTCSEKYDILIINTGSGSTPYEEMAYGASYNDMWDSSHGEGVNRAMRMVKTRYMLLVDSDVLFLQDIQKPYQAFKDGDYALMGEVVGDRGGKRIHQRVNPWFCFIDNHKLLEWNIKFYDHYRSKVNNASDKIYDIGCTMFEDVLSKNLTIADVKLENKYFKHYEGMSWRVQKYNPNNGDTDIDIGGTHDNIALYEYGLKVREQYLKDIETL